MGSLSFHHYIGIILAIATPVLSFFCAREATKQNPERLFIFRPVTMLVIILLAIVAPAPVSIYFKGAIICGLLVAFLGDSLMMIPGTPFIVGMISFGFVGLLYFFGFAHEAPLRIPSPFLILIVLYAVFYFRALSPFLGEFWFPSIVLIVLLSLTAWQAMETFLQTWAAWSFLGLAGALMLGASASIFGIHSFRGGMKGDRFTFVATYHVGQWFLALAVWGDSLMPF